MNPSLGLTPKDKRRTHRAPAAVNVRPLPHVVPRVRNVPRLQRLAEVSRLVRLPNDSGDTISQKKRPSDTIRQWLGGACGMVVEEERELDVWSGYVAQENEVPNRRSPVLLLECFR